MSSPSATPEPQEPVGTVTVRIDAALLAKLRVICAHTRSGQRNLRVTEYLDSKLRPCIDADYLRIMERIAAEQTATAAKKKKQ